MTTVGIASPGAMGSAVGAAYRAGGARVVATVASRSPRTAALAASAGLELLTDVDAVVASADLVLSVVPPGEARAAAAAVAAACARTGADCYQGRTALAAAALLTAQEHGVADVVLDDLGALLPSARGVGLAASKAWRYVDEMREIAATQEAAGLPAGLFEGVAQAYELLAQRAGDGAPEDVPDDLDWAALLDGLR